MENKNTKIDNPCTILIPTYNRPNRLRRLLDYYNKYGKDSNIIVADSSSNENKKLNKKNILLFSDLNIFYLDNYSSEINLFHKIADALNYINTKYTVFCADDDFITPNGINKSMDFLEKNPDFTVAHGHYIIFCLKNKKKFFWTSFPDHKSVTFSEIKSRLVFSLSNCQLLTLYGVRKTKHLKKLFKEVIKFTEESYFPEFLLNILNVIYGKIKCLDILYEARELILGSGTTTTMDLIDLIKKGTYNKEYARFRECLSIHLSKKSDLTIKQLKKLIDGAMPACLNTMYKRRHSNPMIKITKFLRTLGLPSWMYGKMRELYWDLSFIKNVRMDPFWNLIDKPSSKYYNDFNKIRNHVLLHSKK